MEQIRIESPPTSQMETGAFSSGSGGHNSRAGNRVAMRKKV